MTNSLTQQSVETIRNMISVYETNETEITTGIASIEDKYKKLIEQESGELKKQLSEVTSQKEIWKQMLSQFTAAKMESTEKTASSSQETEISEPTESPAPIEEEDTVVDPFAEEDASNEEDSEGQETAAASPEDEWPTFPEEWNL